MQRISIHDSILLEEFQGECQLCNFDTSEEVFRLKAIRMMTF